MKTTEFQDVDRQNITVQMSSLATEEAFRIYVKGDEKHSYKDDCSGCMVHPCIHLNKLQAQILIAGLQDLFDRD